MELSTKLIFYGTLKRKKIMLKNSKKRGMATRAIHAGQEPDKSTGAIMVPIYATSTYIQRWI